MRRTSDPTPPAQDLKVRGVPRPSRRRIVAGLAGTAAAAASPGADGATRPDPGRRPVHARARDDGFEVLEVGPGKRFPSLTLAGCFMTSIERWNNGYAPVDKIARMGFRIVVSPGPPGYYVNDSGSHSRRWRDLVGWPPYEGTLIGPVIVEGDPSKPAPVFETDGYGDGVLYYQTGLFSTGNFDATFRRLVFRGFRRRDGNGNYAAIRLGQAFLKAPVSAAVTLEDCEISGCDDGILGGVGGQRVTLRRCHFHHNGSGSGLTHNIYVGAVDQLTVEDLLSTNCNIGHLLKTRAARTVIRNSRLLGLGGTESACLDVPDAGVLEIDGLVCEKSADSDAGWMVHYSGENQDGDGTPFHLPSSVRVRNLTLVAPAGLRRHPSWGAVTGFANQSGLGERQSGRGSRLVPVQAEGVQAYGLTARGAGLPCRTLPGRPALDARSPVRS